MGKRGPKPSQALMERSQRIADLVKSGKTLEEVSAEYGISRERVRQIFRQFYPDYQLAGRTDTARGKAAQAKREVVREAILNGCMWPRDIHDYVTQAGVKMFQSQISHLVDELRSSDAAIAKLLDELKESYEPAADLVGKRFGAWTVLSGKHWYLHEDGTYGRKPDREHGGSLDRYLECVCDCQHEPSEYVSKRNLLQGMTTGCRHCFVQRSESHISKTWEVPVRGKASGRRFKNMKEAAAALKINYSTLRRYIDEGQLIDGEQWERLS